MNLTQRVEVIQKKLKDLAIKKANTISSSDIKTASEDKSQ